MRRRKGKNRVRFFLDCISPSYAVCSVLCGTGMVKDTPAVDKQDQQNVQQPPAKPRVVHGCLR